MNQSRRGHIPSMDLFLINERKEIQTGSPQKPFTTIQYKMDLARILKNREQNEVFVFCLFVCLFVCFCLFLFFVCLFFGFFLIVRFDIRPKRRYYQKRLNGDQN